MLNFTLLIFIEGMRLRLFISTFLILFLIGSGVKAQDSSKIGGTIKDENGAKVSRSMPTVLTKCPLPICAGPSISSPAQGILFSDTPHPFPLVFSSYPLMNISGRPTYTSADDQKLTSAFIQL